jgi:hypothetical protein
MEVNAVSLSLMIALISSLLANIVLAEQLYKASKKMKEMRNDRNW